MNWTRQVRTWHKWISIVVGGQLLMWTLGGLIFSLNPIEVVHGDPFLSEQITPELPAAGTLIPLSAARATAGTDTSSGAHLSWLRARWVWVLDVPDETTPDKTTPVLIDARSNQLLSLLSADEASAVARMRSAVFHEVLSVTLIEQLGGEFKKARVPAWRVSFADDEHTNVYVDARTGEISKVRTDIWRRFDFFWMLHIMDYDQREDFSHPLLTGAAALGVSTALTGICLAVLMLWPRRRRD